jgi:hypothetical protein
MFSVLGSAARSALAVTTAFSVASIAFGKTSDELTEARKKLADYQFQWAELQRLMAEGGVVTGLEEFHTAMREQENIVKSLEWERVQQQATAVVNLGASFALLGHHGIQVASKMGQMLPLLRLTKIEMIALSPAVTAATTSLTGFGAALSLIAAPLAFIGGALIGLQLHEQFFGGVGTKHFLKFWGEEVPNALFFSASVFGVAFEIMKLSFGNFMNSLIGMANAGIGGIVKGFEGLANSAITAINAIIRGINKLTEWTGLKFSTMATISLAAPQIPFISAATGFAGVLPRDTMFMAHSGERVQITPTSKMSSGGGGNTININVAGSVWEFDHLYYQVAKEFKERLKNVGFTGMG